MRKYVEGQIVYDTGYYSKPAVVVSILDKHVLLDYIEEGQFDKQKFMVFPKTIFQDRFQDDLNKIHLEKLESAIERHQRNIESDIEKLAILQSEYETLKSKVG